MSRLATRQSQRGITLVIGLIMLVLITLVVTTAFSLSTTNLRSVGNMQVREEAISAANSAIADLVADISSANPPSDIAGDARLADKTIDIDNDGTADYTVEFLNPSLDPDDDPILNCVRASQAINESLSSVTLPSTLSSSAYWNSIWEIIAEVTDDRSGAKVRVREGLRVLLTQAQKDDLCA